jgi:hypothetical protein
VYDSKKMSDGTCFFLVSESFYPAMSTENIIIFQLHRNKNLETITKYLITFPLKDGTKSSCWINQNLLTYYLILL